MQDPVSKHGWKKPFLIGIEDITGAVAMWAIRQHPYHQPEKLEVVIEKLTDSLMEEIYTKLPKELLGNQRCTIEELHGILEEHLMNIPEFVDWNLSREEREKGVKPTDPERLVSRWLFTTFDTDTPPEKDFIGLDALIRNTCNTILLEQLATEKFFENI
jgi:hypothetical protein